jgi:hypothetical protein
VEGCGWWRRRTRSQGNAHEGKEELGKREEEDGKLESPRTWAWIWNGCYYSTFKSMSVSPGFSIYVDLYGSIRV